MVTLSITDLIFIFIHSVLCSYLNFFLRGLAWFSLNPYSRVSHSRLFIETLRILLKYRLTPEVRKTTLLTSSRLIKILPAQGHT